MACHADCSPGFWKNHTELWDEEPWGPDDMYNDTMTYLDALQGGKDTRFSRFEVSGWLNARYPDAPCQD
jgi:hypothetical protein